MNEFDQKKEQDDEVGRKILSLFQKLNEKGKQEAIEYALSLLAE